MLRDSKSQILRWPATGLKHLVWASISLKQSQPYVLQNASRALVGVLRSPYVHDLAPVVELLRPILKCACFRRLHGENNNLPRKMTEYAGHFGRLQQRAACVTLGRLLFANVQHATQSSAGFRFQQQTSLLPAKLFIAQNRRRFSGNIAGARKICREEDELRSWGKSPN